MQRDRKDGLWLQRPEVPSGDRATTPPRAFAGVAIVIAGVLAITVLAVSLVAPRSVDASRDAATSGDLSNAVQLASAGATAAPFASSPLVQQAVVAEQAGELAVAASAARAATRRSPGDWRAWFVLARVEVARGDHPAAVSAYRRARVLNPRSHTLTP